MKSVILLSFLAVGAVWADESSDRAAIEKVIATLNNRNAAIEHTADFDNSFELARLRELRPVLTISHQPWGEASFRTWPITVVRIRFITLDVATADAVAEQTLPVLFVLQKSEDRWKIASIRFLAAQ